MNNPSDSAGDRRPASNTDDKGKGENLRDTGTKITALDAREIELLSSEVAEKAMARIASRLKWPLIFAAAIASYTGYNLWSDVTSKIKTLQNKADEKLAEIDKTANDTLEDKLNKALEEKKADISEVTNLLRKESVEALVEAERARAAARGTHEVIKKQSDEAVAEIKHQAEAAVMELEATVKEVTEIGDGVVKKFAQFDPKENGSAPPGGLLSQEAFKVIHAKDAIAEVGAGQPVTVAILSTGVSKYPATAKGDKLDGRLGKGASFVPGQTAEDGNGHGTSVASIVASLVPAATILPVKVLSDTGNGLDSNIMKGLHFASTSGARIVILPIGGEGPESALYKRIFSTLRSRGILVFASAGSGREVGRPANCPPALAVAASDNHDKRAGFSASGPTIAFAAPGVDILTIDQNGDYGTHSGTTFSAAIAGSIGALILSARPDLTADEVETILRQSASTLDWKPEEGGAGRLDALAAVKLAKSYPIRQQ